MLSVVSEKRCTKCNTVKPVAEFSRDARSSRRGGDGLQSRCKRCVNGYYKANQVHALERMRVNYELNRERKSEYGREYRKANRSRVLEYSREYHSMRFRCDSDYRERMYARLRARRALKRSLPSETVLLRDITTRDDPFCWMCGDELSEYNPAHLDHLIPLRADADLLAMWNLDNPGTVRANMALACPSCNIRKSNRVLPCALARYLRNLSADYESEIAA